MIVNDTNKLEMTEIGYYYYFLCMIGDINIVALFLSSFALVYISHNINVLELILLILPHISNIQWIETHHNDYRD